MTTTHNRRHMDRPDPGCAECDTYYRNTQRQIFAAARVVSGSDQLRYMDGVTYPGEHSERAAIAMGYVENIGADYATPEDFDDRFSGVWPTFLDFAEDLVDDLGYVDGLPDNLKCYFDYEKFARDLLLGGDYDAIELSGRYDVLVMRCG